jgi:hypothetical protein
MKPTQLVNFFCSCLNQEFRPLPLIEQPLPQVEVPKEFQQLFESVKMEFEKSKN